MLERHDVRSALRTYIVERDQQRVWTDKPIGGSERRWRTGGGVKRRKGRRLQRLAQRSGRTDVRPLVRDWRSAADVACAELENVQKRYLMHRPRGTWGS